MSDHDEIRSGLLTANGIHPDGNSETDRQALHAILKRDAARARRAKWTMIAAWGTFVALLIIGGLAKFLGAKDYDLLLLTYPFQAAWILAIVLTLFFFIRRSNFRHSERKTHMLDIESRLASIEDALRHPARAADDARREK